MGRITWLLILAAGGCLAATANSQRYPKSSGSGAAAYDTGDTSSYDISPGKPYDGFPFPKSSLRDRGGRAAIQVFDHLYQCGEHTCFKVYNSKIFNIPAGSYILSTNGRYFGSILEWEEFVHQFPAGTRLVFSFLNAQRNMKEEDFIGALVTADQVSGLNDPSPRFEDKIHSVPDQNKSVSTAPSKGGITVSVYKNGKWNDWTDVPGYKASEMATCAASHYDPSARWVCTAKSGEYAVIGGPFSPTAEQLKRPEPGGMAILFGAIGAMSDMGSSGSSSKGGSCAGKGETIYNRDGSIKGVADGPC